MQYRGFRLMPMAEEYIARWGADNLYPLPSNLLYGINIPQVAKEYLVTVGLPRRTYAPGDELCVLPLTPAQPPAGAAKYPLLYQYPPHHYRLLSYFEPSRYWGADCYIAIEEPTGIIWYVSNTEPESCLVNSSIQHLALSLLTYRDIVSKFLDIPPEREKVLTHIMAFHSELEQIDPLALSRSANFWPEQIYAMEIHW